MPLGSSFNTGAAIDELTIILDVENLLFWRLPVDSAGRSWAHFFRLDALYTMGDAITLYDVTFPRYCEKMVYLAPQTEKWHFLATGALFKRF